MNFSCLLKAIEFNANSIPPGSMLKENKNKNVSLRKIKLRIKNFRYQFSINFNSFLGKVKLKMLENCIAPIYHIGNAYRSILTLLQK